MIDAASLREIYGGINAISDALQATGTRLRLLASVLLDHVQELERLQQKEGGQEKEESECR